MTEDEMVGWHHQCDGCESWIIKRKLSTEELMLLNCGVREDS